MNHFAWIPAALVVTLLGGSAYGQSQELLERVREHDERGLARFAEEDFAAALGEMTTAQELLPATPRLYNMAVCEERLGRPVRAIALFRRFVEADDAPPARRQRAEERLAALRAQLESGSGGGEALETQTDQEDPATSSIEEPTESTTNVESSPGLGRLPPSVFYATLGVTLASGVALAILGGVTVSVHNDFEGRTQEDPELDDLESRGDSLVTASNAMLGVTAACATATIVIAILTRWRRSDDTALVLSPEIRQAGSGLMVSGRF